MQTLGEKIKIPITDEVPYLQELKPFKITKGRWYFTS